MKHLPSRSCTDNICQACESSRQITIQMLRSLGYKRLQASWSTASLLATCTIKVNSARLRIVNDGNVSVTSSHFQEAEGHRWYQFLWSRLPLQRPTDDESNYDCNRAKYHKIWQYSFFFCERIYKSWLFICTKPFPVSSKHNQFTPIKVLCKVKVRSWLSATTKGGGGPQGIFFQFVSIKNGNKMVKMKHMQAYSKACV